MSFFEKIGIKTYNRVNDWMFNRKMKGKPPVIPEDALHLGDAIHPYHPKSKLPMFITPDERAKHLYVCGGTGMGKSRFLEHSIRQDLHQGKGIGIIDCHGDLINNVLAYVACHSSPERAAERMILVDPTDEQYVVGFNPLERVKGQNAYRQALELMDVFKKIWEFGPRMDEVLRNTLVALASNGRTLTQAPRFLTDLHFRQSIVAHVDNPDVRTYFSQRFDTLSEGMQAQFIEPVLNKTQTFTADPAIRYIIGQRKSTLNLRQIMDDGMILLVNLSKGYLKENALLLGALMLSTIQMTAMSRSDMPLARRRPWYLYIDEFQNFATESFSEILSEARKYGLSLVLAHQSLSQLDKALKASILSNILTHVYFRLSKADAAILGEEASFKEKRLYTATLIELEKRKAIAKIKGQSPYQMIIPFVSDANPDDEKMYTLIDAICAAHCRRKAEVIQEVDRGHGNRRNAEQEEQPGNPDFAPRVAFNEEGE